MTIPMINGRVGVAPPTVTGVEVIMITVLLEVGSTVVGIEVMIMVLLEFGSIVDDIAVNTNQHKNIIIRSSIRLTYPRDETP